MKKEELSKFYLKFRLYIFPSVVALSSLIMIVFIIYPQALKLIDSQKQQEDLITKSQFLEAKAAALENLDDSDLTKKVSYVLNAYPQEPDFVNVLGILQTDANQNGFGISALTVNSGASSGSSQKYTVKLDAIGSRNSLSRFITSIESSGRLIKVKSIEISPGRDTDSANVSLEVEVLYASIPSSLGGGSADSPLPVLSEKDEQLITTLAGFSTPLPAAVLTQSAKPVSRGRANPFE